MARQGWQEEGPVTTNLRGDRIFDPNQEEAGVWGGYTQRKTTNPDGSTTYAPSARAVEVDRYRSMGEAAAGRAAYQANYGQYMGQMAQSQDARRSQTDALGMQRDAAMGNAPSRAEHFGRNMIDQSLQSQMAGAASARGGSLAQAAAMRNASNNAATFQAQGMNNLAALRADEMARARADYFAGATGLRAGDYQGAGMALGKSAQDIQNEQFQRSLNQQGQQWYEGRAFDANQAAVNAEHQQYALESGQANLSLDRAERARDRQDDMLGAGMSAGAMLGAAALISDIRAKDNVTDTTSPELHKYLEENVGPPPYAQASAPAAPPVPAQAQAQGMSPSQQFQMVQGIGQVGNAFGRIMSDDRAKVAVAERQAYMLGRAHEMESRTEGTSPWAYGGPPRKGEAVVDADPWRGADSAPHEMRAASSSRARKGPQAKLAQLDWQDEQQRAAYDRGLQATAAMSGSAVDIALPRAADAVARFRAEQAQPTREPAPSKPGEDLMASANRAQAGSAYAYKPEFRPPDQAPGEVNVGPMAQNMAANPIAATAVKQDPQTGMLSLAADKLMKLQSAGIGSLQAQVDALKKKVGR